MGLYNKYILPRFLSRAMKDSALNQYRKIVVSEASGITLEIGFGTGLNIPFYTNVSKLYALEPSAALYELAQEIVQNIPFPIEHLDDSAECISLPDNSVDSVVSTWTLCSIPEPQIALREVARVLKPGGKFLFVEHGQSPQPFFFKVQNLLTPFTKRIAGGCHINRNIEELVLQSGFEIQKLEKFALKAKPLAYMYQGVAIANK